MTATKKLTKRLDHAANRVPAALEVLGDLRRAIQDGKPISALLAHCDEMQDTLLGLESAVGTVTQAKLFE